MKIYNPQWNADMDVDDSLGELMAGYGYSYWHTGGGCMAWHKPLQDGTYLMITLDSSLGQWSARHDNVWLVGRYRDTSDSYAWISWGHETTLAQAIYIGERLPVPTEEELFTTDQTLLSWNP